MWKWYGLALLFVCRLMVHTCSENDISVVPSQYRHLSGSPVCPPKLPLIDLIRICEKSTYCPDLSSLGRWTTHIAQRYPSLFNLIGLLGILEHIAENVLLVSAGVYILKAVLQGLAQSFCWLLTLALGVAFIAIALNTDTRLWKLAETVETVGRLLGQLV